jgi:dihydrofolate reductase
MERNRKVILYIAMSLDGYISKPNDDLSFLSLVHKEGEDYGFNDFMESVDVVILGRKTYDWVMTQVTVFPHLDKETYVITRNIRSDEDTVQFYTGDLSELIHCLKEGEGKDIFFGWRS